VENNRVDTTGLLPSTNHSHDVTTSPNADTSHHLSLKVFLNDFHIYQGNKETNIPFTVIALTDYSTQSSEMTIEATNEYLEKIRQKRLRNEEKISQLGLTRFVTPEKTTRRKKKQRSISSSKVEPKVQEPRRSPRVSNKPVNHMMLDYDSTIVSKLEVSDVKSKAEEKRNQKKIRSRPRKFNLGEQISPKERSVFESIDCDEWVKDMEYYFSKLQGNSVSNVQRVMCTVRKLVSGEGVRHPQTQTYFLRNKAIHLGFDFREMLDEATEWVYENGGDRGNGWLIEHPVKKLLLYQQARVANNNRAFSE
jgi:hypothetical protein